ncbi:MAG: magnesium transporter [Oceanospirillaceae bacterium]|jgi:magnesium transporter
MKTKLHELATFISKKIESETDFDPRLLLDGLSASEIARLIEAIPAKYRKSLWSGLPQSEQGEVLLVVHRDIRRWLIQQTPDQELLASLTSLQIDELADIDEDLPESVVDAMVGTMDNNRLQRYNLVKDFPDDYAGGLMDTDATAIRADVSLKAVHRYLCQLRRKVGFMPEHLDSLVVVDRNHRVQGSLLLSDLVSLNNKLLVSQVMSATAPLVDSLTPAREVAQLFQDRDLISAAVVDTDNKLLGRITVDDIIDVLRDESDREIYSKAGLDKDSDMFAPVIKSALKRAIWLGINLITAFTAAAVIGLFEASIEQLVALAVLMPVVASMGGITGSQTLTLVTRGIALQQVGYANISQLTRHELKVSALNGLLWSSVVFLVANFWYQNWELGLVFAVALFAVSLAGTFSGAIIPLLLKKLGIDPAIAGGVVLTTITDALGFFIFLGAASQFLI